MKKKNFTWLKVGCQLFGDDDGEIGVFTSVNGGDVGQFGFAARCRRPRDGDVGFLQGDLGRPLSGTDGRFDSFTKLGRSYEEQVFLLLRRDQHVVLVFAFFFRTVLS